MKVRVLGCSGGIGGDPNRTTSFLVDDDILIDAGTGVGDLTLDELTQIRYVFLTHSHLDHIAALPLLVDTVGDRRGAPLTVVGLPETLEALKTHIFNWTIWPDFVRIPSAAAPFMQYRTIVLNQTVELTGRRFTALPAAHSVPAISYALDSGRATWVFSGDTAACPPFWAALNAIDNLRYVVVETAFPDEEARLALASQHYCPAALAADMASLARRPEVFITHLKPGFGPDTVRQVKTTAHAYNPQVLERGQVFEF